MTQEESMWCKQVDYNNGWHVLPEMKIPPAEMLLQRMQEQRWKQLLYPVVIDRVAAIETFKADKQVAKIFSSVLDVYDMLPLHPDLAFDAAWRTFEYTVETYANVAWGYVEHPFVDTVKNKLCTEVLCHLSDKDVDMKEAISHLFSNLSLNCIQYSVTRIFHNKQLSVAPQTPHVYDRTKDIIDVTTLEHIRNSYTGVLGFMEAKAIRDISRRFYRLMNGLDADFNGKIIDSLTLNKSLQMLINVILYTSRCERFHGDFYTPFRSTRTKMDTYYNYYYLTVASYTLFWCVLHKLLSQKGLPQFVLACGIKNSVVETFARMNTILPNDIKKKDNSNEGES